MSKEYHNKLQQRAVIIANLWEKTHGEAIRLLYNTGPVLYCVFANKPDQPIQIQFAGIDTWDKCKSKFAKLLASDGICVVCCEKEKGKTKLFNEPCCTSTNWVRRVVDTARFCQSCCEFVCQQCVVSMRGSRCAVCRQCVSSYIHILEDKPCPDGIE